MRNTILFDLDGTLVPFMQDPFIHAYFKALVAKAAPHGYDGEKLLAALWKGTGAMLKNDGSRTNREAFWDVFARELGEGVRAMEDVLEEFYRCEFDTVRCVVQEQRDLKALMGGLRQKGYTLILATNPIFPAVAVETRLRWIGLQPCDFDYVTTYENNSYSKPNPDYYRAILEKFGKEPARCLMVGNNPVDDLGAMELGISCRLVTDYLENPDDLPLNRCPCGTFAQLEEYLKHLPVVE